jgi:hypothetical protein
MLKKQGMGAAAQSEGQLPFNQDACFTKCIVQLLLISAASEIVEKFYDQLSLHVSIDTALNIKLEPLYSS